MTWAGLTAGAITLHATVPTSWPLPPLTELLKPAANLLAWTAMLPGRASVRLVMPRAWHGTLAEVSAAYGLGMCAILMVLWMMLIARRKIIGPDPCLAGVKGPPAALKPDRKTARPVCSPRRRFIVNSVSYAAGAIGIGLPAKAAVLDPPALKVRRYRVPINGLPRSLEGMRIVHVSDTHLGAYVPAWFIEKAVKQARALQADLYVLTGDYVLDDPHCVELAAELLAPLAERGWSRFGAIGVLGNHDWWTGASAMTRAMEQRGIRMIDNDRVFIDARLGAVLDRPPGHEEALCIAGLGDLTEDVTDPFRAFRDVPRETPTILLTHQPDTAELSVLQAEGPSRPRIDLMLCGHTHGGQVRLPMVGAPLIPSRYGSKYEGGLVRGPRFPVVVSRGVGMSMLPIRWGVAPEIGEITLVSA